MRLVPRGSIREKYPNFLQRIDGQACPLKKDSRAWRKRSLDYFSNGPPPPARAIAQHSPSRKHARIHIEHTSLVSPESTATSPVLNRLPGGVP